MFKKLIILILFSLIFCDKSEDDALHDLENDSDRPDVYDRPEFLGKHESKQSAFMSSFSSILVSEIGDKTFFVAMIMSMRFSKETVFFGCYSALFLQTVLSCAVGYAFCQFIPMALIKYGSAALFFFFGGKLIYDGYHTTGNEGMEEEYGEVEKEMEDLSTKLVQNDVEKQNTRVQASSNLTKFIFINALTMTFLGEMGDRSQIATVVLSSLHNPYMVCIGALLGHFICTGAACWGGHMLKDKLNQKTICYAGGALFLLFGIATLL